MYAPLRPGPVNIKELSKQKRTQTGPVFPMDAYICAGRDYTTAGQAVPAPMFRRRFSVKEGLTQATLLVNGLGLYEAHCNGLPITKGPLAPYRANPDHLVFFDRYDLTRQLTCGENVLAFLVGVGLQSSVHPKWKWSVLPWRGPVQLSFSLQLTYADGSTQQLLSDKQTKTAPSAIVFNDYHLGEYYDARLELPGWTTVDFDDSGWSAALPAPRPRGEGRLCTAEPIAYFETLEPVALFPFEDGYIYDFGVNYTGVCRLQICGTPGQKILLQHFRTADFTVPGPAVLFVRN